MIHTLWNKEIAGIIDILSFTVQKHLDICIEVKEIITIGANKKYPFDLPPEKVARNCVRL